MRGRGLLSIGALAAPAALGVLAAILLVAAGLVGVAMGVRIAALALGLPALALAVTALPIASPVERRDATQAPRHPLATRLDRLRPYHLRRAPVAASPTSGADMAVVELERAVRFSESSGADFDALLRRRLLAIVDHRLSLAGIDPDDQVAVESLLGPHSAAVLSASLAYRRDDATPGPSASAVLDLLKRLEKVA